MLTVKDQKKTCQNAEGFIWDEDECRPWTDNGDSLVEEGVCQSVMTIFGSPSERMSYILLYPNNVLTLLSIKH